MPKKEHSEATKAATRTSRFPGRKFTRTRVPEYVNFYANNAEVTISPWDIRLKFSQIVEADEEKLELEEHATIFMSTQHAKAFAKVLTANIQKYEATFGPIKEPEELTSTPWASD